MKNKMFLPILGIVSCFVSVSAIASSSDFPGYCSAIGASNGNLYSKASGYSKSGIYLSRFASAEKGPKDEQPLHAFLEGYVNGTERVALSIDDQVFYDEVKEIIMSNPERIRICHNGGKLIGIQDAL
ncbi:hypothetical protein [Photobacterium damselae]|uniref:hypothetical protein n=1 Tax=Photobacterium damselae TaxID=38293 RepID=UPI00406842C1